MSRYRVFFDFGSTFTKAVAFDMETETLLARVQTPSTVDTDVTVGLLRAIAELKTLAPVSESDIRAAIACSSAAGGLRLAVIGLVPDYTTKAGYLAALGAGARVVGSFSYEMSRSEIRELEALRPDVVLLTGGTDGGNKKVILHNAEMLANAQVSNIIAAGNKSARDEIEAVFAGSGKNIAFAPNVMPEFGKLDLAPVNERIRELFISRITEAKGIARVSEIISGAVMPTPSAVLEAAKLLADGTAERRGFGELLLVDVGGATTDVYSVADGAPTRDVVHLLGLREPYAKRTVEGDLGLYHNLDALAELAAQSLNADERAEFDENVKSLRGSYSVPDDDHARYHLLLSRAAVRTAAIRHAGKIEPMMTGDGEVWVQRGKDLSRVGLIIGAGGPVAFSRDARYVLSGAAASPEAPDALLPRSPGYMLDERYILFAIGLLSLSEPEKALRIAEKYLVPVD